jgi:DNA polymerase III alpha subunit
LEETLPLIYPEPTLELEPFSHREEYAYQYGVLGLSTGEHPMSFYRQQLTERGILNSLMLTKRQSGDIVRVAGLAVVHQRPPTAKRVSFLTLEDADGFINIIFHPDIYSQYWKVIKENPILVVEGEIQRKGRVINVVAITVSPLS